MHVDEYKSYILQYCRNVYIMKNSQESPKDPYLYFLVHMNFYTPIQKSTKFYHLLKVATIFLVTILPIDVNSTFFKINLYIRTTGR